MYIVLPSTLYTHVLMGHNKAYGTWFALHYGTQRALRGHMADIADTNRYSMLAVMPLGAECEAEEAHSRAERILRKLDDAA